MKNKITNTILLIIRIIVGAMLILAGYMKLSNMDQAVSMFNTVFGLSTATAWAVAIGELLTGLGILFGVWTKIAALGAVVIMSGAVYYSKGDSSAIVLLIGSIVLFLSGSGRFAVKPCDPLIKSKK